MKPSKHSFEAVPRPAPLQQDAHSIGPRHDVTPSPERRSLFSLQPDPEMAWIYNYKHPDYNTDRARYLRTARDIAISSAPRWMFT